MEHSTVLVIYYENLGDVKIFGAFVMCSSSSWQLFGFWTSKVLNSYLFLKRVPQDL